MGWQQVMEEHGVEDSHRQGMVHEARDMELAKATTEGRVYVVALHGQQTRSAEQARAFGKTLLMWCAQQSTETTILPENTVPPEAREKDQQQEIVEHWLQHGDLSIVARRVKARQLDKWKKHDRHEAEPPWMVTMTLSDAKLPTLSGSLGKRVGALALGFQMRDVPHRIKRKMQGHIRRWYNLTEGDDKKRKGSGQASPRGKRVDTTRQAQRRAATYKAASKMGGGSGAGTGGTKAWGKMPVGGWTSDQQEQWDAEEQARNTRAAAMQKRVERAEEELRRNPEKVSKKIVGAIQSMGVKPDRDYVDSLAAKVIAYRRLRTRKEGNELFTDKAMARAVREKVEEYEASK
jgi:hypothetical protein